MTGNTTLLEPYPRRTDGHTLSESEAVYSVSELNSQVRMHLNRQFSVIQVKGEISDYLRAASGHAYFTLKDTRCQVRCVMFREQNLRLNFVPKKGLEVCVYAKVELYEPRGQFQLKIESMRKSGSGALHEKFEQLKKKLQAEGLFDPSRKRKLPTFPSAIGIISSAKGSVIQDIISTCRRRFPSIRLILYPAAVQGAAALAELCKAVETANRRMECEVLIIARGGGDAEDLQCFNEEKLARQIAISKIPVVSGVGHQTDFTICDFVSDLRAATPTASAELVCPEQKAFHEQLLVAVSRLQHTLSQVLTEKHGVVKVLAAQLRGLHPLRNIEQLKQKTDELSARFEFATSGVLNAEKSRLSSLLEKLQICSPAMEILRHSTQNKDYMHRLSHAVQDILHSANLRLNKTETGMRSASPLAILKRGYALATKKNGTVIKSTTDVETGEDISLQLDKGKLDATIKSKKPEKASL